MAQTYQNVEVIVVDDCGPVSPAQVVLASYDKDRVKVIGHEKNMGASQARNTGVTAARGELILPLDSDDLLAPNYLERTVPEIDADDVGGVYTAVKNFGLEDSVYDPEWTVSGILCGKSGALVCMLYRRKIFEQIGGYDISWRVGEDSDFFLRASRRGWRFKKVDDPLYLYRKHAGATTAQYKSRDLKEMALNLLTHHKDLCQEHIEEVISFKEERYWELFDQYQHLDREFHKLLALYNDLESATRDSSQKRSLLAKIADKLGRS